MKELAGLTVAGASPSCQLPSEVSGMQKHTCAVLNNAALCCAVPLLRVLCRAVPCRVFCLAGC